MDPKDLIHYLDIRIENTRNQIAELHAKIESYQEIKGIVEKEIKWIHIIMKKIHQKKLMNG